MDWPLNASTTAHAFNAGLVDECQLLQLELLEEHRFGNGGVNLRYRI